MLIMISFKSCARCIRKSKWSLLKTKIEYHCVRCSSEYKKKVVGRAMVQLKQCVYANYGQLYTQLTMVLTVCRKSFKFTKTRSAVFQVLRWSLVRDTRKTNYDEAARHQSPQTSLVRPAMQFVGLIGLCKAILFRYLAIQLSPRQYAINHRYRYKDLKLHSSVKPRKKRERCRLIWYPAYPYLLITIKQ